MLARAVLCLVAVGTCRAALRQPMSEDHTRAFYRELMADNAHQYAALGPPAQQLLYEGDNDIAWTDAPGAWHQSVARIVDHRFKTFDAMFSFVMAAKKASALNPLSRVLSESFSDRLRVCPGRRRRGDARTDPEHDRLPGPMVQRPAAVRPHQRLVPGRRRHARAVAGDAREDQADAPDVVEQSGECKESVLLR